MVDALASDRSDQPFGEAVLPRRAWGDGLVADAHGAQSVRDGIGLSSEWIFSAPFDVHPIQFVAEGPWAAPVSPERTAEAIEFMSSLFEDGEQAVDADRTGT